MGKSKWYEGPSGLVMAVIAVGVLTFLIGPFMFTAIFSEGRDGQQIRKAFFGMSPSEENAKEETKFKEVERVAQGAQEAAQKLAPENPPLFWQAERVVFHPDSVWVILLRLSPQGRDPSVGLVIHKSHEYYSDWLGFAGTAAARDDNPLTTRLFYVGLVDPAHPESPAAYLSPFSSHPPPP